MPRIVEQPTGDHGVMKLYSEDEARRFLRVGIVKWQEIRGGIDRTMVGVKSFYSEDSINRYLRRQTRKAPPPRKPQRRAGREHRAGA